MYSGYDPERIGILPEFLYEFIATHKVNSSFAKYKIGERVVYKSVAHKVLALNVQDDNAIEYALDNVYHLVWEFELNNGDWEQYINTVS